MADDPSGTQATLAVGAALGVGIGSLVAGRYHVRGLVGTGGMGAVFRAHDKELDEVVALKVIKPELVAAASADAIVRFRLEVKLARRIAHPNVARTYDLGEAEGVRYLTMELVEGDSLRHVVHATPLSEALRIAAEVAAGLAAVHAGGVVHRDLKPDNVLLAQERVVITDFGIARAAEGHGDALRTSGDVVGTPAYIAPEQLEGGTVDGRADVYALGVMLFELIAHRYPFAGESPTALAVARLVGPPTPLRDVAPDAPEGVAALVHDMLARRAADRPDAHTVVARLARLRGSGGGVAAPVVGSETRARLSQAFDFAAVSLERTVRIAPPDSDDATTALATDLATALADALVKERVRLVKTEVADEIVELAVRAAGDRVRVRARLVDRRGEAVWAERIDGALADPFALEDAVVDAVAGKLRARTSSDAEGPDGPARARYLAAKAKTDTGLGGMLEAIDELEVLVRELPADPWSASLLARTLASVALQTGADDETKFARAEELALRAIDRDPGNAAGYSAISVVRSVRGEHAAALSAAREALRRSPLMPEAHVQIGRMLCWAGRVAEGLQRFELAFRLDPGMIYALNEKVAVLALMGDRAAAEATLATIESKRAGGSMLVRLRLFAWWEDRELARESVAIMEKGNPAAAWQTAKPLLAAYAAGDMAAMSRAAHGALQHLISTRVVPRQRALMLEIASEMMMLIGDREETLRCLDELARIPSYVDLLWVDRCPSIAPLRGAPEYARLRAVVAERIAQLVD